MCSLRISAGVSPLINQGVQLSKLKEEEKNSYHGHVSYKQQYNPYNATTQVNPSLTRTQMTPPSPPPPKKGCNKNFGLGCGIAALLTFIGGSGVVASCTNSNSTNDNSRNTPIVYSTPITSSTPNTITTPDGTEITVTPTATPTPTIQTLKNSNGIIVTHSSDDKETTISLDNGKQNASLTFLNNGQAPIFGTTDPNAEFLVDGDSRTTVDTIYNRIQKLQNGEEITVIFNNTHGTSLSIAKNKKGGYEVEVLQADKESCNTEITPNGDGTHGAEIVSDTDISGGIPKTMP